MKAEVGASVGKRPRGFLSLARRFTAAAISQPEKNKFDSKEITRVGATQRVGNAKFATFFHVDLESGFYLRTE